MPDKVIEMLRAKYLVSPIRYEGLQRIEELEYPEDSLKEAILNAVAHKDYTGVNHKSRYFCYALLETGLFRSLYLFGLLMSFKYIHYFNSILLRINPINNFISLMK